ncbi:F0F1 ATP synthase subunit gamma [Candidatus Microgenomates bacterium]|nr:F0F1 ATP synthase subunit gamma [Candidatus Microgenomates bacterium]
MIGTLDYIRQYIETGRTLKMMAEVYGDLAANRLEQIRRQIERNREFAAQLALAYREVKTVTSRFKISGAPKKNKVNVLLFSNHGYFMNMETAVFQLYKNHPSNDGDLLIIGRTGSEILNNQLFDKPFDNLIFDHDLPKPAEIGVAAGKLAGYEKINVFFPQLKTVATQEPTMVDISAETVAEENNQDAVPEGGVAILEPEGAKMLAFFEAQILGLLMEQAFLEAELSRTAARFLAMDEAQQKAESFIKEKSLLLQTSENSIKGKAILEMTLGYIARKK